MPRVNPGRLRDRFRIEKKTESSTAGGLVPTWTDQGKIWGELSVLSVAEQARFQAVLPKARYRIVLRGGTDLDTKDYRLVHLASGRILSLASVRDPDLRGEYTELLASENL